MTEHKGFVFFWRTGSPFSQWHPAKFTTKSVVDPDRDEATFVCAEQYMMAEKALLMGDTDCYDKIMVTPDPRKQKALGRSVRHWKESTWKKWRKKIVFAANMAKFSQNAHLLKKLMDTGDKTLVEASPSDTIWGVGLRASDPRIKDPKKWRGTNLLGYALVAVRENLKEE